MKQHRSGAVGPTKPLSPVFSSGRSRPQVSRGQGQSEPHHLCMPAVHTGCETVLFVLFLGGWGLHSLPCRGRWGAPVRILGRAPGKD